MSQVNTVKKPNGGFHEFIRKKVVSLKRKPQFIPMLVLAVAFLVYSLNLSDVSHTTSLVQHGTGLCEFAIMLFSLLSFVCFMNAFPHRKKTNILMLTLLFVMVGILVFCDIYYRGCIHNAITREESPLSVETYPYLVTVSQMLNVHMIIVLVGAALTAALPVLRKLLSKIDTSLPVEDNGQMGTIELTGEE